MAKRTTILLSLLPFMVIHAIAMPFPVVFEPQDTVVVPVDATMPGRVPVMLLPSEVRQGDSFTILVLSETPLEDMEIRLSSPDKTYHLVAPLFPLDPDKSCFPNAAILSIPTLAKPGKWNIALINGQDASALSLASGETKVTRKNFVSESIALSVSLTKLRAEPDPQKEKEARELARILSSFDPDASFLATRMILPVPDKRRTSFFGDRRIYEYSTGAKSTAVHAGIDFAGKKGTPVLAAGRGKVILARNRIVTGNSVVIEHLPGVFSVYFHLDSLSARENTVVEQGFRIGTLGATGLATGPHLHWEVRVNGVETNPDRLIALPLLDKRAVFSKINVNEGR